MKSQIEPGPQIKQLVSGLKINGPKDLLTLKDVIFCNLIIKRYRKEDEKNEESIRWRRTAEQILEDGYVYRGKSCTDTVVVFLALCKELGVEACFVKVRFGKRIHSLAEAKIKGKWYIFDVDWPDAMPEPGRILASKPYRGWHLWKKGRDAWAIGLTDSSSMQKIYKG